MVHVSPSLTAATILPEDSDDALLVGRVWSKAGGGPSPVILRGGHVHDLTATLPRSRRFSRNRTLRHGSQASPIFPASARSMPS